MADEVARDLHQRAVAAGPSLRGKIREVVAYFARHPDAVASSTAKELALELGASDATVIRASQALGYGSLKELKAGAMEAVRNRADPTSYLQRNITTRHDDLNLSRVLSDSSGALRELEESIAAEAWTETVRAVADASRVVCYGVQPVGFVADYLAFFLERAGMRAVSSTSPGINVAYLAAGLEEGEALVVFAAIQQFPEYETLVRHANAVGVVTVLVTEAIPMPFQGEFDHVIATPQTSFSTASDALIPLVLCHALAQGVEQLHPERAVEHLATLNALRKPFTP